MYPLVMDSRDGVGCAWLQRGRAGSKGGVVPSGIEGIGQVEAQNDAEGRCVPKCRMVLPIKLPYGRAHRWLCSCASVRG